MADLDAAYQAALAKIDAKTPYRSFIQVKLDALPATAAPANPAPAAAASPAAPAKP